MQIECRKTERESAEFESNPNRILNPKPNPNPNRIRINRIRISTESESQFTESESEPCQTESQTESQVAETQYQTKSQANCVSNRIPTEVNPSVRLSLPRPSFCPSVQPADFRKSDKVPKKYRKIDIAP